VSCCESSQSTLYRLLRQGKIPSFKIGKDWRFQSEVIVRWMDEESMSERPK
jgi:excisionase family DNA binding protein